MTVNAGQLILDALQKLGVYAATETLNSSDAQLGLNVLNDLMDSWSNENLVTYANLEQSFTLVPGTAAYTCGTGGTGVSVRPLRIPEGPGRARIRDTNNNDYDIAVITQDQWNLIGLKTNTSDIPDTMFYDPQYPLGIINIFPVPQQAYTLFFDSYLQLQEFPTLSTNMSLPLGYKLAITTNLALELQPYFTDAEANPLLVRSAAKALGNIKRTNMTPIKAVFDPEIVSRASPVYNIYRDRAGGT